MNLHTINSIFTSGFSINYQPVQLPDIPARQTVTLLAASGSTGPIYIGSSGLTWQTGFPLYTTAGFSTPCDNTNLIFAVMESGYLGDLRIFVG